MQVASSVQLRLVHIIEGVYTVYSAAQGRGIIVNNRKRIWWCTRPWGRRLAVAATRSSDQSRGERGDGFSLRHAQ